MVFGGRNPSGLCRLVDPISHAAHEAPIEDVARDIGGQALLIARHAALGGDLIRIAITRAAAVGEKTGWRAAMPVTQWVWTKP